MREVSHEMNDEKERAEAKRLADVAEAKRLADNTPGEKMKRSLRSLGKKLQGE